MKTLTQNKIDDIRSKPDTFDWLFLSSEHNLSEEFIREFKDELDLRVLTYFQNLPDKLGEELEINPQVHKSVFHCGSRNCVIVRYK